MLEKALSEQDAETNVAHTWVVLAAGSTGYDNYRHQASVCHMYQVARKFGIPDSRIIVFMADDIANDWQNPFPGQIFNYFYIQGGHNVNVYENVVKDYVGPNATADNLLAVLLGEKPSSGSGKTVKATKNDNVFFYYDDHGNTDYFCMPYGRDFDSSDFRKVFSTLQEKQNYKNWVIFIQACMSGSLFYKQTIPDRVYVATSAPIDDSAYACFEDQTIGTFVTSCWPRGWIPPMDEQDPSKTTFDELFADAWKWVVQNSTEPCQYGDAEVKKLTMKQFFGVKHRAAADGEEQQQQTRDLAREAASVPVRQEDVPLALAISRYERSRSEADRAALERELSFRKRIDSVVADAAEAAVPGHNGLMRTSICTVCNEDCECYGTCLNTRSSDECQRTCCGYHQCYDDSDAVECTSALSQAFRAYCGASKHDYLVSATRVFNRVCRFPNPNIQAAINVFKQFC